MNKTGNNSPSNEFEFLQGINLFNCYHEEKLIAEKLYYKLNNQLSIKLYYPDIEENKASNEIEKAFGCKKFLLSGDYKHKKKKYYADRYYYFLDKDILVSFGDLYNGIIVFYSCKSDTELLNKLKVLLEKSKRRNVSNQTVGLIYQKGLGLEVFYFGIDKVKLDLKNNYNEDFIDIHKTICSRLQNNKDKGLVLLHGKPGTGKTNYIRHLVSILKKDVIYLPPNFAEVLTSPEFISFFLERKNSILVFEDAENIVMQRTDGKNIAVSNLLNLCDGMLSDCLHIQIICTFNTDLSKIDKALMRKGRLIAEYEFKQLTTEKAQQLSDSLGFHSIIKEPMTLAEIYNQNERTFEVQKQAIGFKNE